MPSGLAAMQGRQWRRIEKALLDLVLRRGVRFD